MTIQNDTSRSPFAQSFFLANRYNPPLPAQFCASRRAFPLLKPSYSIGLMETLCVLMFYQPTSVKTDTVKKRLMFEALSIEIQHCLALLGASTRDAEKRELHSVFSP